MPAYLIDASIYIFQAHFSPYVECTSTEGEELSALYGFSQFMIQFLRRHKPQVVAAAMDESLFCGFRHEICPRYKSNRELPDENLEMQLRGCSELCEILGVSSFGSRRYEADDIIGTLARRLRSTGGYAEDAIAIITRDKDLAQLVLRENDYLWDYQKNLKRGVIEIVADFGVTPQQIPDYLGLVGDSVDCIGGVPGLGPVKGKALLGRFDTLEDIYENLDAVGRLSLRGAAKLGEKLQENRDLAFLSKRLATIVDDVVDERESFSVTPLSSLHRGQIDLERFGSFLNDYAFEPKFCENMVAAAGRLNDDVLSR